MFCRLQFTVIRVLILVLLQNSKQFVIGVETRLGRIWKTPTDDRAWSSHRSASARRVSVEWIPPRTQQSLGRTDGRTARTRDSAGHGRTTDAGSTAGRSAYLSAFTGAVYRIRRRA